MPAHADGRVAAIRTGGSQVRRAEIAPVPAHPIYCVAHNAEFEIPGQLDTDAEQAFAGDGGERVCVADLGQAVAERESRGGEDKHVTERSPAEGLHFHIAAEHVTGEIGTGRIGASELSGGWQGAAGIGLVGGRRELEIQVAAEPMGRKERAVRWRAGRWGMRRRWRRRIGALPAEGRTGRDHAYCNYKTVNLWQERTPPYAVEH